MINNHSNIVIFALGGVAKRFSDFGIHKPKFLLPYMSGTILSKIISPIDFRNSLVLFVVNDKFKSSWPEIEPFLMDKKLNYKVMFIGSSNGQAHTVELGLIHLFNEGFNTNCPLFIFNGDTITHEKDFSYMISMFDNGVDGIIEYFESIDPSYSYISTDSNENIVEMKEKVVFSNKASTGFYAFANANCYVEYCKFISSNKIIGNLNEFYVSTIYQHMLQNGKSLVALACFRPPVVLGTPKEYFDAL